MSILKEFGIKNIIAIHKLADRDNIFLSNSISQVFSIDTQVDNIIEWYLETGGTGDLKILIPK